MSSTHSILIVSDSQDRKNLLKSACLLSQKRPISFSPIEKQLAQDTRLLVCDLTSPQNLAETLHIVKGAKERQIEIIYLYDKTDGVEKAKRQVEERGLIGTWRDELAIDCRSNWAKLLGAMELATKVSTSPQQVKPGTAATAAENSMDLKKVETISKPQPTPSQKDSQAVPQNNTPASTLVSILLVDDSESARDFVKKKLMGAWKRDLIFDSATTGQEAKEKCLQKKYDILFLDVVLPDLDGYAVCKNLKNTKNVDSMAVMLTSKGGTFDKLKGVMSGCDMYLDVNQL